MIRDKRSRLLGIAAIIAVTIWMSVLLPGSSQLRVTFLDIGDGLCTIIQTPSGRAVVVDCGTSGRRDNSTIGTRLVAPYLQSLGLNAIDVAILSHPHSDHLSGMAGLLKLAPATLVLDCGKQQWSPEYAAFKKAFKANHSRYRIAQRGQVIDMGDGVKIQVLNPSTKADYSDFNDNSTVLRVTYKRVAILLAADAGKEAEEDILESHTNVHAQVLQVGHHGSKDATSTEWLSTVRPRIAVISCSGHSRYGFPAKQTLDRLASLSARTYCTGRSGAVTIITDGNSIDVRTVLSPR